MYNHTENIYSSKYFDKRAPEEDNPLQIDSSIHDKYQQLEVIYDEIFDEESHHQAKVKFF
jgi:hypothetical protein